MNIIFYKAKIMLIPSIYYYIYTNKLINTKFRDKRDKCVFVREFPLSY